MSFQSLRKEGWKSQKLLVKLCHDCLSKRTPVISNLKRYTTMSVKPHKSLLDVFRTELYQPTKYHNPDYSSLNVRTIDRRQVRNRLLENYYLIKKQQPALFTQLTLDDLDKFTSYFLLKPPNDPQSAPAFRQILKIYEDWKSGKLFPHLPFRQQDLENMIYITTELGLLDKSEQLLREAIDQNKHLSSQPFEDVIRLLSKEKRIDDIDHLLKYTTPTLKIVQSVVLYHLGKGELEKAAQFLRDHHPGEDLSQLVSRHSNDDRELLDQALNVFAMDSLKKWRLNDMRTIYHRKRFFGMSTYTVIHRLVNKGLHTGQVHIVEKLLDDTMHLLDTTNIQLCAKQLIHYYITRKKIIHAVAIWEKLANQDIKLPCSVLEPLVVQAAKLKYHVDTMRMYKQLKILYPNQISPETPIHVLRGLVYAKQFERALDMCPEVEPLISLVKPSVAKLGVRTLFGLSAQTGNLTMFERIFALSDSLELNLAHKGLTSLIAAYLSRKDVASAKSAFQSMASNTTGPDVVDFNLLMLTVAFEDAKDIKPKILEILKHMKMVGIAPNRTTMRTLIGIYKDHSDMQTNLFDRLLSEEQGSRSNEVFINNIALTLLLERTDVERAAGVLLSNDRGLLFSSRKNQPIHCNGLTYTILLDAATRNGKTANIAEKLFKSMRSRGLKPSRHIYENLVEVFARQGKIAKARRYIATMEQEVGEKAGKSTYLKLVDGLLDLKKPELAKQVIERDLLSQVTLDSDISQKLEKIDTLLSK